MAKEINQVIRFPYLSKGRPSEVDLNGEGIIGMVTTILIFNGGGIEVRMVNDPTVVEILTMLMRQNKSMKIGF